MNDRDIVYILKDKSSNDYQELKYSLRSLRNLKYRNIWIIGGSPTWIHGVQRLAVKDEFQNKQLNALFKITAACHEPEISDDFILMNDDFYIMKPTEVPYLNQGDFKQRVEEKRSSYNESKYWYAMKRTAELFEKPLDFELHFPIVYNKKKFLKLARKYNLGEGYLLRSLYCNHYKVKSELSEDYKGFNLIDLRNHFRNETPFNSSGDRCVNTLFDNVMKFHITGRSIYES